MISSWVCHWRFPTICIRGNNELIRGNWGIRKCDLCFSSRAHGRITRGWEGTDKWGSSLISRKITGDFLSFVWVRTSTFSFKRLFLCISSDCQNIFLNFHLNFLACTTLNVREKGWGESSVWEQSEPHRTHLFHDSEIQKHSLISGLKHQLPICATSPLPSRYAELQISGKKAQGLEYVILCYLALCIWYGLSSVKFET